MTQQNEKLEVERHTLRAQQILQMGLINEVINIDLQHNFFYFVTYYEIYLLCIQNMTIKLPQIGDGNFEVIFFSNGNVSYHFLLFHYNNNNMCDNLMWFSFEVNVRKLLDHLSNSKDITFLFQAIKVIANLTVACFFP